jgi:nitrate reductase gamma subunit
MTDLFFFGIFPYVAVALAVAGGIYRYSVDRFSWSSNSSQFLENRALFWGSVPWHYAIIIILLAHLLAFLFPGAWGALLGRPGRLYLLEAVGMSLGVITVLSLILLMVRRAMSPWASTVTPAMSWVVAVLLLLQVLSGVYIALALRWGSFWYLHTATPWLWSLVRFDPQVEYMAVLPWIIKIHAINAFVLVAIFPFSRLVHIVSVPFSYLARPYQVVNWTSKGVGTGK